MLVQETALVAEAFLDDHWPAVRRLVRVLCAHRLPITLPGPVAMRLIETTSARLARFASRAIHKAASKSAARP